jgi:Asp/Glu/hydantoin racemase
MTVRIWYQSMTAIGHLPRYLDALQRHAQAVCGNDVAITWNGASEHWYEERTPAEMLRYPYVKHVIQREAIDFCRRAEIEGHDAVILGSFSEPWLAEIRSILKIPVISMPESALLTACMYAERFALVPLAPAGVKRAAALVARHALGARVSGIESLPNPVTEAQLEAALAAPQAVSDDFTTVARKLVEGGADVIIPAEGVLSELLFWNNVRTIEGATVMDCIGNALATAQMMVQLQRTTGMGVGRRWAYTTPPPDILRLIDSHIPPQL